jgi:hypothetical protein
LNFCKDIPENEKESSTMGREKLFLEYSNLLGRDAVPLDE